MKVLIAISGVVLLSILTYAHIQVSKPQSKVYYTATNVTEGVPPITQASIDLALLIYNIKVPREVRGPTLDLQLIDRGLTHAFPSVGVMRVTIGPSAFTSWSVLGSTLAHEIEVHCHQNFAVILGLNLAHLEGTTAAERMAYIYEVHNAQRFGSTADEVDAIIDTMMTYYPRKQTWSEHFRSFIIKNLMMHG